MDNLIKAYENRVYFPIRLIGQLDDEQYLAIYRELRSFFNSGFGSDILIYGPNSDRCIEECHEGPGYIGIGVDGNGNYQFKYYYIQQLTELLTAIDDQPERFPVISALADISEYLEPDIFLFRNTPYGNDQLANAKHLTDLIFAAGYKSAQEIEVKIDELLTVWFQGKVSQPARKEIKAHIIECKMKS